MADFALADDFLPVYDVSDAVATVAEADRKPTWEALLNVDLLKLGREAPMVGMLGALRMLPEIVGHLIHGERLAKAPQSMRLRDLESIPMAEGGWILLQERPGEEIALGLVGKFWRPVIEFARIESAEEFHSFDEPGFAKTVYDLAVREVGPNRRSCLASCAPRRPMSARDAGFVGTGRSGWGRAPTSSSGPCSTPHDARPKLRPPQVPEVAAPAPAGPHRRGLAGRTGRRRCLAAVSAGGNVGPRPPTPEADESGGVP